MERDIYGQMIYTENDLCRLYMADRSRKINKVLVDLPINIDPELEIASPPTLVHYVPPTGSIEDFDALNQSNWHMPRQYYDLDIAEFVLSKCTTDIERDRVGTELLMFLERDMFTMLQYMVYLVDTMRSNGIVWGVGRGSSVSSYVLYLIGVHKINSLKYDLDITEFLR